MRVQAQCQSIPRPKTEPIKLCLAKLGGGERMRRIPRPFAALNASNKWIFGSCQTQTPRSTSGSKPIGRIGALAPPDRHVDGVVDVVLDATRHFEQPLSAERLFGWHAALFPTGFSGMTRIRIGTWRDDSSGPMQVVSGYAGREKVHYQAPPAPMLETQTQRFFDWFNADTAGDALIKAGLAHLWLGTLHPFDDGNGRISRAVGDMALARADKSGQRFYSLSAQVQRERKDYYDQLESAQKGSLDVTAWLAWFLACLLRAVLGAEETLATVLGRAQFWQRWAGVSMNQRQIKILNHLLDGFEGKLTSTKWATIAKCSTDTALRDINELLAYGVLR